MQEILCLQVLSNYVCTKIMIKLVCMLGRYFRNLLLTEIGTQLFYLLGRHFEIMFFCDAFA